MNPALDQQFQRLLQDHPKGIPFRIAMEQALYGPDDAGYYSSGRASVGKGGDFATSVSIGAIFGKLLARHVAEVWEALGSPDRMAIIEQGANDGRMMADILSGLSELECADTVFEPVFVEPIEALRDTQQSTLQTHCAPGFSSVRLKAPRWVVGVSDLTETDLPAGIFLCNELIDAFPVDRLRKIGSERYEYQVIVRDSTKGSDGWKFDWISLPQYDPRYQESVQLDSEHGWPDTPEPAHEFELRSAATQWIRELANSAFRGHALIIDYGFAARDAFHSSRSCGTLQAYRDHQTIDIDDCPDQLGDCDLTTHIDFTQLVRQGAPEFEICGFANQGTFLTKLAAPWLLELERGALTSMESIDKAESMAAEMRQFQTLTHPGMMGGKFQMLGLWSRDVETSSERPDLSGFAPGNNRSAKQAAQRALLD